jgi:uncharacterized protein YbjQ (UPF0145 family)
MHLLTIDHVPGYRIVEILGVVSAESIRGANFIKDIFANFTDTFGGSSGSYENSVYKARREAMEKLEASARQLGANAVIGIDLDFELLAREKSAMMLVSANGTAVRIAPAVEDAPQPDQSHAPTRDAKDLLGTIHASHFEAYR